MTPDALAACHARAFEGHGRPWTASEFVALLDDPYVSILGDETCFLVARAVSDEIEILTLACHPAYQRQGKARAALKALLDGPLGKAGARLFLEVAEDNQAARALYNTFGFEEIGRRHKYYSQGRKAPVDAVLLGLTLINS